MLTNLEEDQSNTNPFNTDTDGDVLPDGEENGRGMKPHISDLDDDGLLDGEEVTERTGSLGGRYWLAL
jgi:hypothetical protein